MKKLLSIFLSVLIVMSVYSLFGVNASTEVKEKSLRAYTSKSYTIKKSASKNYLCKVKYNDSKQISVSFKDNGETCVLKVAAKAPAKGKKPLVKIYYKNKNKEVVIVKALRYTITPAGEVNFKNYNINVKTSREVKVSNPFNREYKFKASESGIIKIPSKCSVSGTRRTYNFKALKEGSVTLKVYLKGTKTLVGSFKITTGDFKTRIIKKYKNVKLKYNSHGSSTYMSDAHLDVSDMLNFKHADAKYYAEVDNEAVAAVVSSTIIHSVKEGSTKAAIYEKRASKKIKVGTMKIKTVSATMAYVAKQNALFYDNKIFGYGDNIEFLDLEDNKTLAMKSVIKERLLNNSLTSSSFKASEYIVSFKSTNEKAAKVTSSGKVSAVKKGSAKIKYTITFSDKSTYSASCKIIVE